MQTLQNQLQPKDRGPVDLKLPKAPGNAQSPESNEERLRQSADNVMRVLEGSGPALQLIADGFGALFQVYREAAQHINSLFPPPAPDPRPAPSAQPPSNASSSPGPK